MTMAGDNTLENLRFRIQQSGWRLQSRVALVAAAMLLAGCSSAPEWADPGEWGSDGQQSDAPAQPETAAQPAEGFPNLSSVPGEAPQTSSRQTREDLKEGLSADRTNARYSDQALNAESTLVAPAAPPPSVNNQTAAAPVAPAPVTPAPVTPSATPEAMSVPAVPAAPAITPKPAPAPVAPTAPVAAPAPAAPPPAAPTPAAAGTDSSSVLPPAFPARSASQSTSTYVPPTFEPSRFQLPGTGSAATATRQAAPAAAVPGAAVSGGSAAPGQLTAVVYFGHGSASLDQNDMKVLRDVVAIQRQNNARIVVVGHSSSRTGSTDAVNHRAVNLETSLKRANAVTAALVRLGVPKDRLVAEARADNQPVFHEFMPTGEAGNRRAEIYLAN